jgi:plasmid stability protein
MPRTTLALDDRLFRDLKQRAAREGRTLGDLVNELLVQATSVRPSKSYRFRFAVHEGGPNDGLQPGVDLEDRDRLHDLMEGTGK